MGLDAQKKEALESELNGYLDAIDKSENNLLLDANSQSDDDFLKHHNSELCADEVMRVSPDNLRLLQKHQEDFKLIPQEQLIK